MKIKWDGGGRSVTITRGPEGSKAAFHVKISVEFDPEDEAARDAACAKMGALLKAGGVSGDGLDLLLAAFELDAATLAAEAAAKT